jgi:hypothetical protein
MSLLLNSEDVALLARAIAAEVAAKPAPIAATVEDLQVVLRCPSKWATQQEIKALGLKPYRRGKYRLRDVENAIARRTRG